MPIRTFEDHEDNNIRAVAVFADKRRMVTGSVDKTLRLWDLETGVMLKKMEGYRSAQVGHPWKGHTSYIDAIAIHPAGTFVASASSDNHVRLWRLSDRRTIAIFQHSSEPISATSPGTASTSSVEVKIQRYHSGQYQRTPIQRQVSILDSLNAIRASFVQILAITAAHDACITGDLSIAEELLAQDIHANNNDYTSYSHRSFILARKHAWDLALDDAIKSTNIQPSLTGYISKGIALCGKGHSVTLFSADQYDEAMLLIKELSATCPNTDPLARRVVETYLHVQLGINALHGARHDDAANYFTVAVNSTTFSSKTIHLMYDDLTVVRQDDAYILFITERFAQLFGWDLESLCLTAHQKRCQAFLSAGKYDEALEAHKYMMNVIDESAKASCLVWSNGKEKCSALAEEHDRILGAEIPGQGQDGYDAEANFFHGMHQHPQISRLRPQQRPGRLKRLKLAMKRTPRPAVPPAPSTPPPVTAATTFGTLLRHLFIRLPRRVASPVVDVPFAQGKERNAAADAPGTDPNIVRDDEYVDTTQPEPNIRPQQKSVTVPIDTGEHGGGWSCCC
ncbi:hypothetical protein BDR07DRAFT_1491520 [Suillus spraguei]|nr:hypothetical protein BDR07DRAFT_1491520 [Suillus spraguei]